MPDGSMLAGKETIDTSPEHAHELRVEEYRALRAEILSNADYQKMIVIWGNSALATIFGFIFGAKAEDIKFVHLSLFLAQVLATVFLYAWERISFSTETIGTYIGVALERHLGLGWELFQRSPLKVEEGGERHVKTPRTRLLHALMIAPFLLCAGTCAALLVFKSCPGDKTDVPAYNLDLSTGLDWLRLTSALLFFGATICIWYFEVRLKGTGRLWKEALRRYELARTQRADTLSTWQYRADESLKTS